MSNDIKQKPVDQIDCTVLRLVISWDREKGQISVGGNLDDTNVCLEMMAEAGHILLERRASMARQKANVS